MKRCLMLFTLLPWGVMALADDTKFSTHLHAKFQAKACTSCHDYFVEKLKGLDFGSHKGRKPDSCVLCHRQAVTGFEHPEEWFARPGLYTSGMSAKETCETMKAAIQAEFKSKALIAREMEEHLLKDPRVLWGIEGATANSGLLPGGQRDEGLVKGGFQSWKEQVRAWIKAGMSCD